MPSDRHSAVSGNGDLIKRAKKIAADWWSEYEIKASSGASGSFEALCKLIAGLLKLSEGSDGKNSVIAFADAILHGDEIHRSWLREAAEKFVRGEPLPPSRQGGGLSHIERSAIAALLELANAVYHGADNSEQRGMEHIIEAEWFGPINSALENMDTLPDDNPNYVMSPNAKAAWALRNLLATPAPSPIGAAGMREAVTKIVRGLIKGGELEEHQTYDDAGLSLEEYVELFFKINRALPTPAREIDREKLASFMWDKRMEIHGTIENPLEKQPEEIRSWLLQEADAILSLFLVGGRHG